MTLDTRKLERRAKRIQEKENCKNLPKIYMNNTGITQDIVMRNLSSATNILIKMFGL